MKKHLLSITFSILFVFGYGQISTSVNPTVAQMQALLQGNGIVISGMTITCPTGAYATFNNGASALGGSLNSGILLTTGTASNIATAGTTGADPSYDNLAPGSPLGDALSGGTTHDGCYINFLVTPACSTLSLNYVFASEEYPEFAVGSINDVFGFVLSGPNPAGGNFNQTNIAILPTTTTTNNIVSIQNVNNGTANAGPCVNCAYYVANPPGLAYDGCTTVLTASTLVTPCQQYTMTVGVWDDSDGIYDSGVFLDFNGISCTSTNTVAASASSTTLCTTQPVTLTVTGGLPNATYNWTSSANGNLMTTTGSSVIANPTSSSTYTVSYHDSTLCAGVDIPKFVSVNFTSPNFSVSSSVAGPLCAGQSTTLTALTNTTGVGSYTWMPNTFLNVDNVQMVVCTPTASITYTVTFDDGSGCTSATSIAVSFTTCTVTGINAINETDKAISIYPNPVNSKLYFSSELNLIDVKIYNQNGQQLIAPITGDYINCSHLNSGVYTIQFKTEKSTFYKKFVKMD